MIEKETVQFLLLTSDVLASGFLTLLLFFLAIIKGKELKSYERTEGNCVRLLENDGERELRPNSLLHQRRAGFPVSGQRFG